MDAPMIKNRGFWSLLLLLLHLLLSSAPIATPAVAQPTTTARLCHNGESEPFASLTLEPGTDLQRAAGALLPGCEEGSCRVFDQHGFEVSGAATVRPGQLLFLVPEGRHFIWPAFHVGYRTEWPGEVVAPHPPITLETLSESPRVFRVENFFDEGDADFLVENAQRITDPKRRLQRSKAGAGNDRVARDRTSKTAFDTDSPVAQKLMRRAFDLLGIRPYNERWADGLQVLRYNWSQAFVSHYDYHNQPPGFTAHEYDTTRPWGTNRFATLLLYLNDVKKGGETVFDFGTRPGPQPPVTSKPAAVEVARAEGRLEGLAPGSWEEELAAKCATRLAVPPRKAGAVLFYSQRPEGGRDDRSAHGGCPVVDGVKWAANLWVWNGDKYVAGAGPGQPRDPRYVPPAHRAARQAGMRAEL